MAPEPTAGALQPATQALEAGVISHASVTPLRESCSIGFLHVNRSYELIFADERALRICGLEECRRLRLADFLGEQPAKVLQVEWERGTTTYPHEHEFQILRGDGRQVPIAVTAVPLSPAHDPPLGYVAVIRSLALQKAAEALEVRVRCSKTAQEIFRSIVEEVGRWVPFELSLLSAYKPDLTQARVLFAGGKMENIFWPNRWFDLKPEQAEWLKRTEREPINDLEKLRNDPRWRAAHDAAIDKALAGLQSSFRVPVVRNGQVAGSIVFFRKTSDAFKDELELELLHKLPLDHAVLLALSYIDTEKLRFETELVEQLSKRSGSDLLDKSISELIVNRLAEHYDWEAIAMFGINVEKQRFELQAQAAKPSAVLPDDFVQPLHAGVMGETYRTGQLVWIADLGQTEKYRPVFIRLYDFTTVSELCLPIRIDNEIVGMLNIEDPRRNAFAAEEIHFVETVLNKVTARMERHKNENIIKMAFEWTPSVLFVAARNGTISAVNSTTVATLGYEEQELKGKPLQDVLEPAELIPSLLRTSSPFRDDFRLIHKSGKRIKVNVASGLLGEMTGTIITAREVASQQRIQELDCLERIFYDIAAQTKLPLGLSFSWLTKLKQRFDAGEPVKSKEAAEELDKAIRQLRKAEITYDHLALYDKNAAGGVANNPVVINIGRLLELLVHEFPAGDAKRVRISGDALDSYIVAGKYQVSFVFLALLSYGLRFLPESSNLDLKLVHRVEGGRNWVQTRLRVVLPSPSQPKRRTTDDIVYQVVSDINLGARVIESFVKANGGSFALPDILEGNVEFRVDFPLSTIAV